MASGPYSNYKDQSIGRILHFLYHYCGLHVAETVTVGADGVFLYGKKIAVVEWHGKNKNMPHFNFIPESFDRWQGAQQEQHLAEVWRDKITEVFDKDDLYWW